MSGKHGPFFHYKRKRINGQSVQDDNDNRDNEVDDVQELVRLFK